MGFYNVINPSLMQTGQPEDISQVLANLNAIASVLNGNIDDTNVNAAANIALSKIVQGGAGKMLGINQVPTLAYVPGFQEIQDINLVASAPSFDFQNIPQTFKHLLCVISGRGDTAAVTTLIGARFNNDAGNNYYSQSVDFRGTTSTSSESLGIGYMQIGEVAAASSSAGNQGGYHIWVPNYAATTFFKDLKATGGFRYGTGTQGTCARTVEGSWNSTAAISRLTFILSAGNYIAGSRATLYGIG